MLNHEYIYIAKIEIIQIFFSKKEINEAFGCVYNDAMDSQWLKSQFIMYPDKTKADLARALGLEPPAVSKILSGRRQIKAQEYMSMRNFFGLGGSNDRGLDPYNPRKCANTDSAPHMEELRDMQALEPQWLIPSKYKSIDNKKSRSAVKLFQITDSAMEPRFYKGESVIIDPADRDFTHRGTFIVTDGHGFFARYCSASATNSLGKRGLYLEAESKEFEAQSLSEQDIRVVGRIIGKMVWL